MEAKKLSENQQEMVELVLKELVEEHTKTNLIITDLVTGVNSLADKTNGITEKMNDPTSISAAQADTRQIQQLVYTGISDIKQLIAENRKKNNSGILHSIIETDAKKWLVYLVISIIALTYIYLLFKDFLSKP